MFKEMISKEPTVAKKLSLWFLLVAPLILAGIVSFKAPMMQYFRFLYFIRHLNFEQLVAVRFPEHPVYPAPGAVADLHNRRQIFLSVSANHLLLLS